MGCFYNAAYTGRNSLSFASQTKETVHCFIMYNDNVLCVCYHFSTKVYDVTWERLLLCAIIALTAWFYGYKWVSKVNFKTWLWILVLSFSILHIINYDLSTMDIGGWIRVILKEAVKIPSALMFCYVRIKHGFGTSVALHFAVNLSAYCMGALV